MARTYVQLHIYRHESWNAPIAVDVVVERQLLVSLDIPLGEDAHPHMVPHCPLRHIAVGVTAVVREPPNASAFGRIDKLAQA